MIEASVATFVGSALSRTVPVKRYESCATPMSFDRISCLGIVEISRPSIVMVPPVISIMRKMLRTIDVLPLYIESVICRRRREI
jgi:hypothetical protein